jgi:hypothetical protein
MEVSPWLRSIFISFSALISWISRKLKVSPWRENGHLRKAINPIEGSDSIFSELIDLVESARRISAKSVNAVMTATYWEIGRRIVQHEQGCKNRAGYGEAILERFGQDLGNRFGGGFSVRSLRKMRQFFLR